MQNVDLKPLLHAKGIHLAHVARMLRVDKATMTRWSQGRVPAERVAEVAEATGLSKTEIRPDLWPPEETSALDHPGQGLSL